MGVPVEVDSDDLERIIMATGFVKQIEKVIECHKRDPFVSKDETSLHAAHDRLSVSMRRAIRGESRPGYDAPLTEPEMAMLGSLGRKTREISADWVRRGGNNRDFSSLLNKGMVEVGSLNDLIIWGSSQEFSRTDRAQFVARLTDRGIKMLKTLDTLMPPGAQ